MLPTCFDLMRFTHVHSENNNLHIRKGIENCGVYFSMYYYKVLYGETLGKSRIP